MGRRTRGIYERLCGDFANRDRKSQHQRTNNRITQPSGAATPRDSDAHERIAVPKAFCVLRERTRPRPKSGKVCRSDTRPGDVRERAERSEGSDTTPIRNAPCFAVWAVVCDPSPKAECVYPLSPVKANVDRLCEKLKSEMKSGWGIKFMAAALPDFSLLLVLRVHREPGNVCI